ncbi:MAG: hypothetical protein U9R08_01540 [Nanoarchaeota archaeon]|nr:hypothetical protein [Nanoarchaeota archaeon]
MLKIQKKRNILLTVWLIIMLIGNTLAVLSYLLLNSTIASQYSNVPSWIFYIYGMLSLANLVFVIFLFKWKKWAFYAFCGSAIFAFIMNLFIGVGIFAAIVGLVGPVILYLVMKTQWDLFE